VQERLGNHVEKRRVDTRWNKIGGMGNPAALVKPGEVTPFFIGGTNKGEKTWGSLLEEGKGLCGPERHFGKKRCGGPLIRFTLKISGKTNYKCRRNAARWGGGSPHQNWKARSTKGSTRNLEKEESLATNQNSGVG